MACDYTVLIIPLQNSLYSPDALHCFHSLKKRRDLERQKDILWAGLQVVEQTQLWYQNRLKLNLQRQVCFSTGDLDGEKSANRLYLAGKVVLRYAVLYAACEREFGQYDERFLCLEQSGPRGERGIGLGPPVEQCHIGQGSESAESTDFSVGT
ncbi:suppressor APC domain-containing protein 1 isoform X2 [Puntigrus tetrazona]|uniref:suppressor APC domain-containing protein 1 isoform X2 n=1 Tax=Puntigrus tetrazona TaxID=1606681 RepID=UPI001C89A2C4|nr:suppressor APC domain-containing protein 1 isoform X2 [Puntigrus tetrazona]